MNPGILAFVLETWSGCIQAGWGSDLWPSAVVLWNSASHVSTMLRSNLDLPIIRSLIFYISVRMDSFTECCLSVNFDRHFSFSLSLYLETKMLNSHILVFHSFSLVLVDEKSLHFCQLLVILLVKLPLPTFILVSILHVVFKQNSLQNREHFYQRNSA